MQYVDDGGFAHASFRFVKGLVDVFQRNAVEVLAEVGFPTDDFTLGVTNGLAQLFDDGSATYAFQVRPAPVVNHVGARFEEEVVDDAEEYPVERFVYVDRPEFAGSILGDLCCMWWGDSVSVVYDAFVQVGPDFRFGHLEELVFPDSFVISLGDGFEPACVLEGFFQELVHECLGFS